MISFRTPLMRRLSFAVPAVIEQSGYGGERAYDIYTRLLKDRIICLHTSVSPASASFIISQLLYLDAVDSTKPIYFYINSPGGTVPDGLAIYDTMQWVRSEVWTVGMGMAASMGSLLMSAGKRRMALPHTRFMLHQPVGGARGQATDIKIVAKEILHSRELIQGLYQKHTGQPGEVIDRVLERDTYMSAEEAKEFGLIDEVLVKAKDVMENKEEMLKQ